jgi:hypothetical protein
MPCKSLVAAIAFVVFATSASATTLIGSGAHTCGEYLETVRSAPELDDGLTQWTLGFISGTIFTLNKRDKEFDVAAIKPASMKTFVQAYCAQHLQASYYEAVDKFLLSLPVIPAKE